MGAEEEEEEKEGRRGGRVDREGGKEWKSEGEERVLRERERENETQCVRVCMLCGTSAPKKISLTMHTQQTHLDHVCPCT